MDFKRYKLNKTGYSSRFYRYFLSYILLLVIVLSILSVVVYRNFILTMQDEVEKANISAIKQIQNVMDTRIKEMERIAINISLNNNLRAYRVSDKGFNSLEATRELRKYRSSNEFVYDIALFYNYKNNERIHTTLISTDIDIFFEYIYKYENLDMADFVNMIDSLYSPTMYPVENVLLNRNEDKRFATYIYPLPVNALKPYLVVTFLIEERTLLEMLSSALNEYDGYIYILNEEGIPISYLVNDGSNSNATDILNRMTDSSADQTIDNIDIDGNSYSVARITSDYNGWSYIMATRTDQLMAKVNGNRAIFNYVILSVLILGIVIAFTFALGNYKPLRQLAEVITVQNASSDRANYSDEFDYVLDTIKEVSDENRSLTMQLKSKAGIMRNQLITKILKGNLQDMDELDSMADTCSLDLKFPYFAALIFLVDDYSQIEAVGQKNTQNLIVFSIINVVEELSEEIGCGYGVELIDDRGVALLLNLKEEYIKERYISEIAFKTKEFFKQHFGFTITVGIGNVYEDIWMVHESFLEANRAVYYRLIKGYDSVIFYEDIMDRQKERYSYPMELEEELIMALKQGKSHEVEQITKNITDYITQNSMSLEAVQCICFGIINSIMKTLNEMNIEPNACFEDEKEVLFAQPFDTVEDLSNRIIDFVVPICEYVEDQKESKNFELRDQLLAIVEENYRDSSLSLELIASKFDMSPSYISRYFKDQMGDPIMQYVDTLRMNDVKRLLKETDLPLKEILPQVGYIDQSSFYRKFKKLEGVTPMQYRKIVQEEILDDLTNPEF